MENMSCSKLRGPWFASYPVLSLGSGIPSETQEPKQQGQDGKQQSKTG